MFLRRYFRASGTRRPERVEGTVEEEQRENRTLWLMFGVPKPENTVPQTLLRNRPGIGVINQSKTRLHQKTQKSGRAHERPHVKLAVIL